VLADDYACQQRYKSRGDHSDSQQHQARGFAELMTVVEPMQTPGGLAARQQHRKRDRP
jgi:hypothetical protein